MPSVHSKNLEILNAKTFVESVSETGEANLYMTFGKSVAWPAEQSPPVPDTSVVSYTDVWRNLIGGKKIKGSDLTLCVPRFDWVSGTVYSEYDDRVDSKTLKNPTNKFYVVTDDFNVYKCLYNNNGVASTVKPTLTPIYEPFQTADKYIWKYMYSISTQDQLKFTSTEFIPIKTLNIEDGSTQWRVQNNAVAGAVHVCKVDVVGSGYSSNNIYVQIVGDGSGANAFAVRNATTNTISEIIVDNEGSGYTRANVFIVSGSGSGAVARAVISPTGGHGSDAVTELGGSYVMVSVQFNDTESGKFSVANDFRQVAIIQDPYKRGTKSIFGNLTFSQTTTVAVSGTSVNYQKDEFVYQGNSFSRSTYRGIVLDWIPASNQLKLIAVDGSPINDKLIGYSSGAVRALLSATVQPELEYNSGKLLYIDNISPIQRDASQTEDFKVVLSF
jgi:hypothetical protein